MLYEKADRQTLGYLRVTVFGLWILNFWLRWPGAPFVIPEGLYTPRGWWLLLPDSLPQLLLGPIGVVGFPWVFLSVVAAAMLGLRPFRLWGPLAVVAILLFDGVSKGLGGYVNHAQAIALIAALVLAWSPAADGWALRPKPAPLRPASAYQWPILIITIIALLTYTAIGIHRITHGGFAVFDGESLRSWLIVRSQQPTYFAFRWGHEVATRPILFALFKIGFVITTLLEATALFCLTHRRFALAWLIFMTVFHFLSLFTLNIFFWENAVLLWVLFLPLRGRVNLRPYGALGVTQRLS